ncbi:formylglycine-generating enzyme family protein [Sorangium sp. So ce887]|uniref:formylglycine-generating enzyme family protein n=1 Tax=Sorangium sp. So ce887 TaxID=3133324 RepID=UPI003F60114F
MRQLALLVSISLVSACSPRIRDFSGDHGSGSGGSGSEGGGGGGVTSTSTSTSTGSSSTSSGTSSGGGDGGGATDTCVDPVEDCPPAQSACMEVVCGEGLCAELPRPAQTPCGSDGGSACDGAGACVMCEGGAECGECGEPGCPNTCGSPDVLAMPRSCAGGGPGAGDSCGPGEASCCGNRRVPCGTYLRSYDGESSTDDSFPAAVSDFRLDRFEITVGRFRAFVEAGRGVQESPPAIGAGRHPHVDGSGWIAGWNQRLAPNTAMLKSALQCNGDLLWTWTDEPGPNEELPINCITWFEAFAFCSWDGGRLPSEAEWNYAAAGGDEHRPYPWGSGIDSARAAYGCTGDGSAAGDCALSDILPVGSKPSGDGRWGHSDLAGNLWEWTMDWWRDALPTSCIDCVHRVDGERDATRVTRGGSYRAPASDVRAGNRDYSYPFDRVNNIGARCARDL